jgi:hypothetical protein
MRVFLPLFLTFSSVFAAEEITFHLECKQTSQDCMELTDIYDKKIQVQKLPAFVLPKEQIFNATLSDDHVISGMKVLALTMGEEKRQEFAQLTRMNIGRSLAIVVNNRIENMPMIRDQIQGGKIQISLAPPNVPGGSDVIEKTPWLAELIDNSSGSSSGIKFDIKYLYFGLGGLLVLILILTFLYTRNKKQV